MSISTLPQRRPRVTLVLATSVWLTVLFAAPVLGAIMRVEYPALDATAEPVIRGVITVMGAMYFFLMGYVCGIHRSRS